MRRGIQLLAVSGVLLLAGCMTFESPDSKYALTTEGFKEIGKPTTPASTETGRPATTATEARPVTVSQQHAAATEQSGNMKGAWGRCCRLGQGREPDPMRDFEFSYPLDVDSAYIKIKRDFGFKSRDDFVAKPAMQSWIDTKFLLHLRYEAMPGVHYKMRNFVEHPYGSEESSNTIEVELSKNGVNQVNIRVVYYAGNTKDLKGYEASLKQRIEKTIGNS